MLWLLLQSEKDSVSGIYCPHRWLWSLSAEKEMESFSFSKEPETLGLDKYNFLIRNTFRSRVIKRGPSSWNDCLGCALICTLWSQLLTVQWHPLVSHWSVTPAWTVESKLPCERHEAPGWCYRHNFPAACTVSVILSSKGIQCWSLGEGKAYEVTTLSWI